jgi:predicted metalloprotease
VPDKEQCLDFKEDGNAAVVADGATGPGSNAGGGKTKRKGLIISVVVLAAVILVLLGTLVHLRKRTQKAAGNQGAYARPASDAEEVPDEDRYEQQEGVVLAEVAVDGEETV